MEERVNDNIRLGADAIEWPQDGRISPELAEFIRALLEIKPESRLGYDGYKQVMAHPWLSDIDWENMYNREQLVSTHTCT